MVNDRDTFPQTPTGTVQKLKIIHEILKGDHEFWSGRSYLFSVTKSHEYEGLNGDRFQSDKCIFSLPLIISQ